MTIITVTITGTTVSINGTDYGATQGTGRVYIVGTNHYQIVTIASWADTAIVGGLSKTIAAGSYTVIVVDNSGSSATKALVLTAEISVVLSPSLPAKQRILDAIEYGLTQIKTDDGYNYTIRRVYSVPIALDKITELPAVIIDEGREDCSNANNHLQTGGNESLHHNQFDVSLNCVIHKTEDPACARNKLLADIKRYFGKHYWIPGSDGARTCFNCVYLSSDPWGIHETQPWTGITVQIRIWYREYMTDPTQTG